MVTENGALIIIEEGTDVEVQVESLMCCLTAFLFIH
jgi:hypothetical protein